MNGYRARFQGWILRQMEGKLATAWLFGISFFESSFFPIPPDLFLLPVVVKQPHKWKYFSAIVVLGSILGALFGYAIGAWFFEAFGQKIVEAYNLQNEMEQVGVLFENNAFWAMFGAAFTPIPFKIFTIAGGLFRIDIILFLVASILGRGLRFFVVGYISKVFGERMSYLVFRYFNGFTIAFAVVIIAFLILQVAG